MHPSLYSDFCFAREELREKKLFHVFHFFGLHQNKQHKGKLLISSSANVLLLLLLPTTLSYLDLFGDKAINTFGMFAVVAAAAASTPVFIDQYARHTAK